MSNKIGFLLLSCFLLVNVNLTGQVVKGSYCVIESNSGISALHDLDILDPIAAEIKAQFANFEVLGCDFAPTLCYVKEEQISAFEENFDKAVVLMDNSKESYVMVTKEKRDVSSYYFRVNIKFPTEIENKNILNDLDKEAFIKSIEDTINDFYNSSYNSGLNVSISEREGLEKLLSDFQSILNDTYMPPCTKTLEVVGFKSVSMPFDGTFSLYEDSSVPILESDCLNDYAGISVGPFSGLTGEEESSNRVSNVLLRTSLINSLPLMEGVQGFSGNLIMTSCNMPDYDDRINLAKSKFDSSGKDCHMWLHFDISVGEILYKTKVNINRDKAKERIDDYYESQLEEYNNTENSEALLGSYDCSKFDGSSFSKWRAYCEWVDVEDAELPVILQPLAIGELNEVPFGAAAGLLDGLIETVDLVKIVSKGLNELYTKTPFLSPQWHIDYFLVAFREGSLKKAWDIKFDEFVEFTLKIDQGLSNLWNNRDQIITSILNAIKGFLNDLDPRSGLRKTGYAIGKVAFEIILTALTSGGSLALSSVKKIGNMTSQGLKQLKNINPATITEMITDGFSKAAGSAKLLKCKILYGGCFVKDTPVLMANKNYTNPFRNTGKALAMAAAMPIVAVPIQEVQLLEYAVAHETVNAGHGLTASTGEDIYQGLIDKDPYTSDQQRERDEYELDDENWNEVVFEQVLGGSTAKLALHNDWINDKGYQVDAIVEMNLPEQGISGPFRITSIKHIIPQKKLANDDETDEYNYRPVTALFTHESDQVYDISFDNGESLGVTYQHPIYSTTAGDWKLAGELKVGDQVLTKGGEATVTSSAKKEGAETVYNLEVKELHNFLVGELGIVVHNSCKNIIAKKADIDAVDVEIRKTNSSNTEFNKAGKELGDGGATSVAKDGNLLTKDELFALWAKARNFEAGFALTRIKELYPNEFGQRITLVVTKTLDDGSTAVRTIVPDFVVKNGNDFKIVDAKFTTKTDADFTIRSSLTKNQREVFDWMENGDNLSIKVTANQDKLMNLGISTGDNISISGGVDILKSNSDDISGGVVMNYFE